MIQQLCAAAFTLFMCTNLNATEPVRVELPKGLQEISGLAAVGNEIVYAHNDEHGIVYKVDLNAGDITAAFALGEPTVSGDFEGIAVRNGRVYLITSKGYLYEAPLGEHRDRVVFNLYNTGLAEVCEVEGLAIADTHAGDFFIACKTGLTEATKDRLVVFRWHLSKRLPVGDPVIDIAFKEFLTEKQRKKFAPSAIDLRDNGDVVILSARNGLIVEIPQATGTPSVSHLDEVRHVQAEGLAIMKNGSIVIADEGGSQKKRGAITVYPVDTLISD